MAAKAWRFKRGVVVLVKKVGRTIPIAFQPAKSEMEHRTPESRTHLSMNVAFTLFLLLALGAWLIRWRGARIRSDIDAIARNYGLLSGLGVVAALAVTGRVAFAAVGLVLLIGLHRAGLLQPRRGTRRTQPFYRSPMIEVVIDGEAIGGRVVAGSLRGRDLNRLDEQELSNLYAQTAGDRRSRATLEIYLDRRMPGWRENMQGEAASRSRRATNASAMSEEEAYEILGLQKGAGEADIRAAHRRLMKRVHPDQGGSTFLAVRINQAKDRLLSKHV
ncbi:DnaJ domain-containing protein [Pleomorphomonas diazotrophica]|uniref:DnaJ domain-containing protein n=1 Tax=Pleomorphomonas diazotrophica TaxID=1166257 RepID=UPI0008E483D4|nr:DnaJ domain-containing protein [Pleomorphomonas diazotrophica]SFM44354.1 DnaJ domain-containing protein [Pleomorphomonas diazotrophica]